MVSDVPVSLLLSGGLDSSIIYKILERMTHQFTVFHVNNKEEEYLNDLDIPNDIPVRKIDLWLPGMIDEAVFANQTPVDMGSVIQQYALGKSIKEQGFNVAISGDGADELFGGYRRAMEYDSQASDIYHELIHYHLPRLDRLMMASTVELRCPYLSWDVLALAQKIPWKQRRSKELLKEIFIDLLPLSIIERSKRPLRIEQYDDSKINWRHMVMNAFDMVTERRFENER